jgi:hypothetical protein
LALGAGAGWLVHHHADPDATAGGRSPSVASHHARGAKPHTTPSPADLLAQTKAALTTKTRQMQELQARLRSTQAQLARANRRLHALTCPYFTLSDGGDADCRASTTGFNAGSQAWLREWEQMLGLLGRS